MTILPIFLLASMCLWASLMFSRLNVLSITGFKQPEKCGKTLCENALTRSALYCEGKSISRLSYRDANVFILQKQTRRKEISVWSLTWRLRERRRLLSKWHRLDSSLPSRSPSIALPPMVPYSTHLPSVAKQLTFCSQLRPPMLSRMMVAPLPVDS